MKLVNKNTTNIKAFGEIVPCNEYGCIAVKTDRGVTWYYRSLAELNEEWEDYEEPKPWWYIDITLVVKQGELFLSSRVEQFKTVGNYFETREEAEKAVEKLKAWKRLKDKGYRFSKWFTRVEGGIQINMKYNKYDGIDSECRNDLDLLFGGEE